MSEQNAKSLSISFRMDDGIISHNNREFIPKNVDAGRISDNITYTRRDIHEVYDELFGQALAEYNAKQKRSDRRITDYYKHIEQDGRLKPFYEVVVQFGDVHTCGVASDKWEQAKLLLDDYMCEFEQRNPNLKVFNAVMHLDEATPHLHIDFVPIARNMKKGLPVKVSMKGALREQGFTSSNRFRTEWTAWAERERGVMTDILRKHDLNRDVKDVHREHYTVDEYKEYAAQKTEIHKINEHINQLKKKNPAELTPDEVELILNQNDVMCSEIQKRDEKIASLSEKADAKFIALDIFSEDKLQYVAAELEKANVPFVEENHTLYIPDYAQKTAAAIAETFKPTKSEGIRDRIKLDIDRLVYCSENLDDLYTKLKEHGYRIKSGKYIAVKPSFAERFVRLKTLGSAYTPDYLEQRIAGRDKFPIAIRRKEATANALEKQFMNTQMNMIVEVKQFRLEPRKIKSDKIYTFQNDANINYLSEQLLTIGEFGFTNKEQMYAKAEELQGANDTVRLKRVKKLIKAYEEIVEGDYISNLICREKEKQAQTLDKVAKRKYNR